MIFSSQTLKCIFDVIIQPEYNNIELEIVVTDENTTIAANYSELYYIKCCLSVDDPMPCKTVTVSSDGTVKLMQLVNTWPDCKIRIDTDSVGYVSFEIIHNSMCLTKPIHVECVYRESKNDYILQPPQMGHNCSISSKNLKHMLEFCEAMHGGVTMEIKSKGLLVSNINSEHKITTFIELEGGVDGGVDGADGKIVIDAEACKLVMLFLRNFASTNKFAYLLFINQENAFSVKIYISPTIYYQIYTVHIVE